MKDIPSDLQPLMTEITEGKPPPSRSLDEDGYLREEILLPLTALEAGALEGCLRMASQIDQFMINVKGRDKPMKMTERLIEKLQVAHRKWLKEHGF